jgi:hypothetical protein
MITEISVGKEFPLAKVREGGMIDLKEEGLVCFIGFNNVSKREIMEFRKGILKINLSYINNIIFFVLEIGNAIFLDIPFHSGLIRPTTSIEEVTKRNKMGIYPLHMYLVDTKDNTLKAMRVIGLSVDFSKEIEETIEKQKEEIFNNNDFTKNLNYLFRILSQKDIKDKSFAKYETKKK